VSASTTTLTPPFFRAELWRKYAATLRSGT
jgi:hypothetical protein